jgi:hypothetical protein
MGMHLDTEEDTDVAWDDMVSDILVIVEWDSVVGGFN